MYKNTIDTIPLSCSFLISPPQAVQTNPAPMEDKDVNL